MAFTNAAEWATHFSFENILSGDIDFLLPLFYLIISIAIYSILIYHFYRYIARRDCFKESKCKHSKAVGFVKYFLVFPFIAVIFYTGFSFMLIFLTKNYPIDQLLATSFAIIVAIRITSYYTEDLSKDVAKMLPFALLGVFLVDPTYFTIDIVWNRINSLPANVNYIIQFIFLIILVEWILRIVLNIVQLIFRNRKNSEAEKS
jgi:hypothetical protein